MGDKFKERGHILIKKLPKFQENSEGQLGNIKATTHGIETTEDETLSFQPPYRAGSTQREHKEK